nr:hypothetical protein [uncultured Capnocytophaga sp.]
MRAKRVFLAVVIVVAIGLYIYNFIEDMHSDDSWSFLLAKLFLVLVSIVIVVMECIKEWKRPDDD